MFNKIISRFIILLSNKLKKNKANEIYELKGNEKILIIKLDEIGDFLLMLPLIRELKNAYSGLTIDILTKEIVRNIVELCPYINRNYNLKNYLFKKKFAYKILLLLTSIFFPLFHLRKNKYDIIIVPRWDVDSSYAVFFSFFSFAMFSIAYSENVVPRNKTNNMNYDLLYTHTIITKDLKHEVERYLFFLKIFNIEYQKNNLELWFNSNDEIKVKKVIRRFDDKKIIAICSVASQPRKKWDYKNYQDIINWLVSEFNFNIVIIGGGEDIYSYTFENINPNSQKILDLRGKLTLRQTALALRSSIMYVGNDTGPMHLAAAVGTPIIEISAQPINVNQYHPQAPKRFSPWGVRYKLLQPQYTKNPCPSNQCISNISHCINNVTVKEVKSAIIDLLKLN